MDCHEQTVPDDSLEQVLQLHLGEPLPALVGQDGQEGTHQEEGHVVQKQNFIFKSGTKIHHIPLHPMPAVTTCGGSRC